MLYSVPLAVRLDVFAFLRARCLLATRFQQLESAKVSGKSRTLQEFESIEFPAQHSIDQIRIFNVYLHVRAKRYRFVEMSRILHQIPGKH